MQSSMLKAIVEDFGNGGTIDGDLVVSGDLTVSGGGSLSFDEIIEGTQVIDVTSTEALLVRKNGDGGDVFKVDSTNATIYIQDGIGTLPSLFGGHQLVLQNNNDSGDQSRLALISGATGYSVLDFGDASDVDAGGIAYQNHASDDLMTLRVNGTDFVNINDSGFGIGKSTLESTDSNWVSLELGGNGALINHSASGAGKAFIVSQNAYMVSNNFNTGMDYMDTDEASCYLQHSGTHTFRVSGSGTADASITWTDALTIANDSSATFSGDILGIDGSNSSPSFSFSSDADTGMYREGTNEIGFATGGSRSLKLDASLNAVFSGDIYVNNSTPSLNLQDSDGSNQSLEILHSGANTFFTSRNDSSNGAFFFRSYNGSSFSTALELDSSQDATFNGSIKILDTSAPSIRLNPDASDTTDNDRAFIGYATGNDNFITGTVDNDLAIRSASTGNIVFGRGTTESARFDSSGRLGIGVSPSYPLHVENSGDTVGYFKSTDNNGQIAVVDDDTTAYFGANGSRAFMGTASGLAGTTNLVVDSNGNVGIGTTSPSGYNALAHNLVVYENSNSGITIGSSTSGTGSLYFADGTTGDEAYKGSIEYSHSSNALSLRANSVVRFVLDTNSRMSLSNNDEGSNNTVFGYKAGNAIASGTEGNVIIGHNSGLALNGGDANVAIGADALKAGTTGIGNTVVGTSAADALAFGETGNVAIGYQSMSSLNEGSIGTADNNIAIGQQALLGGAFAGNPKVVNDNIAIGAFALDATSDNNQTGTIAIGRDALGALTSGAGNLAIGYEALKTHTTGSKNIAIGYQSMFDTDAGSNSLGSTENVFIGYQSGSGTWADSATSYNTGIGNSVMRSACDGATNNTGVGFEALKSITTGDNNVAIGSGAGETATTTSACTLVGHDSGTNINHNDAEGTVAYGYQSLKLLTNGRYNTAIGYASLATSANGDKNTAVGFQSLGDVTGSSDGENTAIGFNAGHTGTNNLTSGTQNTLIGASTQLSSASVSNSTVIGYGTIGSGDNTVAIGNASVTDVYMAHDSGALVHCAGIQFPASQVANGGANVLDDYEEGTWTPILSDGTNNFTMVSNQNGRYTKIGRVVHFEAECGTSSIGSASGNLKLIGLPFTSASSTSEGSCSIGFLRSFNYSASGLELLAQVNGGTTEIAFTLTKDDTTEEFVQCSAADSSSFFIRVSGTYFV